MIEARIGCSDPPTPTLSRIPDTRSIAKRRRKVFRVRQDVALYVRIMEPLPAQVQAALDVEGLRVDYVGLRRHIGITATHASFHFIFCPRASLDAPWKGRSPKKALARRGRRGHKPGRKPLETSDPRLTIAAA